MQLGLYRNHQNRVPTDREPGSVKFSKTSNRNLTRNQELPGLLPSFYQEFLVLPVTKIAKPGTETETFFLVGSWFRPKYFGFGRPLIVLVRIGKVLKFVIQGMSHILKGKLSKFTKTITTKSFPPNRS